MTTDDAPTHPAALKQVIDEIEIATHGRRFRDVTGEVARWLSSQGCRDGLVTLFLRHTSTSLTIQENADPDVQTDLVAALDRLAPESAPWVHTTEGPDDMPAHVKTMLTGINLAVPVAGGRMMLGTWQGIYLIEHRAQGHRRRIALHYFGTRRMPA